MSLWSRLSFQPPSMKSPRASRAVPGASAARRACRSRSRWARCPRPKWYCQTRLTNTRAVNGLSFDAIQSASTVRRPLDFAPGFGAGIVGSGRPSTSGKPGFTSLPFACGEPRTSRCVVGGFTSQLFTESASSWPGGVGFFVQLRAFLLRAPCTRPSPCPSSSGTTFDAPPAAGPAPPRRADPRPGAS